MSFRDSLIACCLSCLLTSHSVWSQTATPTETPPPFGTAPARTRQSTQEDLLREQALDDDATLHAVQMLGASVVYAAGERGVLRKSTDGGQQWTYLNSPVSCRWNDLCFLTDKIGWAAGGTLTVDGEQTQGCLIHTRDGGDSWTAATPRGMGMLHAVQFFDFNQGVVCGEATATGTAGIWRTRDGGKTWESLQTTQLQGWRAAAFPAFESGVVAGLQGQVGLVGGTRLLLDDSLNFGHRGIRDLAIDQNAAGWMVGDGGLVRYSPGGAAWQDSPGPLPAELNHLYDFAAVARKGDSVWLAGHPGSAIWRSDDGGNTWRMAPTHSTAPLNSISFGDAEHGCAVGELGTILWTADGGRTWQSANGQSRRLALLQFVPTRDDSSFCLSARYSGHQGYRSGIISLCNLAKNSSAGATVFDDLSLQEGMSLTNGNTARVNWSLPLDLPELEQNQQLLLDRWNRASDGELTSLIMSQLVRDLRTYRPNVVVLDRPVENDAAGKLLQQAIMNAIKAAADPTWFVAQRQYANLEPWQVSRVFERNRSGVSGEVLLESGEYLAGLRQSVRMAAGPAYRLLGDEQTQVPLVEGFKHVELTDQSTTLHMTDLLTGIVLGPGSDARRGWLPDTSASHADEETLARQQKNFSAYARTALVDEQKGASMIAQLNDVVGRAPARQAIQQMLELAEEYRENHQWDYYEAVLMQVMENYADEPASSAAAVQLIRFWASEEMALQRLSNRNTRVTSRQLDRVQLGNDLQQILQTAAEQPELPVGQVSPAYQQEDKAATLTPGTQRDRGNWRITWQQRALAVYELLQKTAPTVAERADVQLALASLYRQRGADRGVQNVMQQYLRAVDRPDGSRPVMQQVAETEFWLLARDGLTPQNYLACFRSGSAPYLDGLLSDECWQDTEEVRLTFPKDSSRPASAAQMEAPLVMLTCDNEYLYLAGSFPRHPALSPEVPRTGGRRYDEPLEGWDRLQVAIDVNRDLDSSYVFEVDQRGKTRDRCWDNHGWNPTWHVASSGDGSHWRVELAIPLSELIGERPLAREEVWAISISRILPGLGIQSWGEQLTTEPGPGAYGFLQFR